MVEVYDKDIYICPHRRGRRRHSADSFSTAQPCGTVGSLAANADNKVLIAKEGGIGRLLAALDKHAEHAGVVERACGAVGNLAVNDDNNKVLIAKEGGIKRLLAALDNHAKHAGVVEQACGALCSIGWSDKALQKSIKDAGAVKLVRAAVGRSNASSNTRKWGQRLLGKLAQL